MSKAIGLAAVVESLKYSEQLAQLRRYGCRFIQFFLFCRLKSTSAIHRLVTDDSLLVDPEGIMPL